MDDKERDEIKNALLRYCELDTLAMVIVYEHLKEITEDDYKNKVSKEYLN
jgi:hypothetical protein